MADNYQFDPGSTSTAAGDDIGGVIYPRVKITLGADGAADTDLDSGQQTMANSVPVAIASDQGTLAVTAIGTFVPTSGTLTALLGGGVAHDAADSGNPIKTGAKAVSTLSTATLVSAADRADSVSDLDGAQIVRNQFTLADLVSGTAINTDGASTQVIAAAGNGVKVYLTDLAITNNSSTNTFCEIKDGTQTKFIIPVPSNSGVVKTLASPLVGTANTAWNFDMGTAIGTAYAAFTGFKSKI